MSKWMQCIYVYAHDVRGGVVRLGRNASLKIVVRHFLEATVAVRVEDVVLQHEHHVEQDADDAKAELGEVPEQ